MRKGVPGLSIASPSTRSSIWVAAAGDDPALGRTGAHQALGCDIDPRMVEWCSENFDSRRRAHQAHPPLPYEIERRARCSVLGLHASAQGPPACVGAECRRVLGPGGFLLSRRSASTTSRSSASRSRSVEVREWRGRRPVRRLTRHEPLQRVSPAGVVHRTRGAASNSSLSTCDRRRAARPASLSQAHVGNDQRSDGHSPPGLDLIERLARLLAWLERLASRRLGLVVLFGLALAVYAIRAIGWPLVGGRDLDEYVYDYIQFLDWHPLLPWSMLFRTPVTPLVVGPALDVAGGLLRRAADGGALRGLGRRLGGCRAGVRRACRAARGRGAPRLSGLRPDVPRALERAGVRGGVRALGAPRHARSDRAVDAAFRVAGLGVALLALVRPGNALLLAFAVFPFVLPAAWRAARRSGRAPSSSQAVAAARRLGGPERRSLRRLLPRARRQRRDSVLPRVHHRPHRVAGQRPRLSPPRERRSGRTCSRGIPTRPTA